MTESDDGGLIRLPSLDDEETGEGTETIHYKPAELLADLGKGVAHFVVVRGARSLGKIFKLRNGAKIGRALNANIQLAESGVSRSHAKVKVLPAKRVMVEDLGSSNGMFVDGKNVQQALLSPGDSVQIGDAVLALVVMDDIEDPQTTVMADTRTDPATGLPSRSQLADQLGDALSYARRFGGAAAICMVSVDQTSAIFAEHGDKALSAVLIRLSRVVAELMTATNGCVARCGTETLGFALPDTDLNGALRSAEWLRRLVKNKQLDIDGEPMSLTCSVGASAFPDDEVLNAEMLIERAERRWAQAIASGRDRVEPLLEGGDRPQPGRTK